MRFKLDIKCDGASFADPSGPSSEVARLIRLVDNRLRHGETEGTLLDLNGNSVGTWSCTEEDADHQPTRVIDNEGDVWRRSSDGRWWCGVDDCFDVNDPEVAAYSFLTVATLADVESRYGIREVLS